MFIDTSIDTAGEGRLPVNSRPVCTRFDERSRSRVKCLANKLNTRVEHLRATWRSVQVENPVGNRMQLQQRAAT